MTSSTMSLLDRAGLDRRDARRHLSRGLEGVDDGELYLEYAQSEMLVFDNGRLKQATYSTDQGFGRPAKPARSEPTLRRAAFSKLRPSA